MEPIIFAVLSAAACALLIYVFVNFHRELVHLEKSSAGDSNGSFPYAGEGQQAKSEAVMRREILISAILGLFGLFAPFIFVMLLNSLSTWHH